MVEIIKQRFMFVSNTSCYSENIKMNYFNKVHEFFQEWSMKMNFQSNSDISKLKSLWDGFMPHFRLHFKHIAKQLSFMAVLLYKSFS